MSKTHGERGQVTNLEVVKKFFAPAMNSTTVTLVSKKTQTRFTYDIKRKEPREGGAAENVWYVDLLSGPDNRADYTPLAVLTKRQDRLTYHHAGRSKVSPDAPSAVALKWAIEQFVIGDSAEALAKVEVWHEGRCARCGRKLTVPTSVALGLGPECAEKA